MVFLNSNPILNHFKRGNAILCLGFLSALFVLPAGTPSPVRAGEPAEPWGYEGGTGPRHWGEMEQDHDKHIMCREGVHQSPVDIREVLGVEKLDLKSRYRETPVQIINNRHTILLRVEPGSYIQWDDERFELIQFHFHHPSEHLLKGNAYPMEIHFVHRAADHEYVVLAVFARVGREHPRIEKLWDKIPQEIDREKTYSDERLSAGDLIPDSKVYYHYTGSLTTPPCTENVTWLVLEEPIEISQEQLEHFQKHIRQNARPVQKLHHRIIVELK